MMLPATRLPAASHMGWLPCLDGLRSRHAVVVAFPGPFLVTDRAYGLSRIYLRGALAYKVLTTLVAKRSNEKMNMYIMDNE